MSAVENNFSNPEELASKKLLHWTITFVPPHHVVKMMVLFFSQMVFFNIKITMPWKVCKINFWKSIVNIIGKILKMYVNNIIWNVFLEICEVIFHVWYIHITVVFKAIIRSFFKILSFKGQRYSTVGITFVLHAANLCFIPENPYGFFGLTLAQRYLVLNTIGCCSHTFLYLSQIRYIEI